MNDTFDLVVPGDVGQAQGDDLVQGEREADAAGRRLLDAVDRACPRVDGGDGEVEPVPTGQVQSQVGSEFVTSLTVGTRSRMSWGRRCRRRPCRSRRSGSPAFASGPPWRNSGAVARPGSSCEASRRQGVRERLAALRGRCRRRSPRCCCQSSLCDAWKWWTGAMLHEALGSPSRCPPMPSPSGSGTAQRRSLMSGAPKVLRMPPASPSKAVSPLPGPESAADAGAATRFVGMCCGPPHWIDLGEDCAVLDGMRVCVWLARHPVPRPAAHRLGPDRSGSPAAGNSLGRQHRMRWVTPPSRACSPWPCRSAGVGWMSRHSLSGRRSMPNSTTALWPHTRI